MEEKFLDYDFTKQHAAAQNDVRLGSEPSGVNGIAGNVGNARDHALNAVTGSTKPELRVETSSDSIKLDQLKYY